jgi:hypothetical protein
MSCLNKHLMHLCFQRFLRPRQYKHNFWCNKVASFIVASCFHFPRVWFDIKCDSSCPVKTHCPCHNRHFVYNLSILWLLRFSLLTLTLNGLHYSPLDNDWFDHSWKSVRLHAFNLITNIIW